ncbi:MAG: Slp family lipoprotein [Dokdonella sp.]|uniref:Slp family lipoprotein n=1 Tax=Dokdonella sp. TaxID=2291710 RepID=UPI003BAF5981
MNKSMLLVPLIATLAACATTPVPLKGEFSPLKPSGSIDGSHSGERVRWGGEIIKVEPAESSTCFEVLSRELDSSARPNRRDTSEGRFIACRAGFYDPEVFTKGRELTVVGSVSGTQTGRVGQFDYTYPRVAADTVFLWPRRPLVIEQRNAWPHDPFWGPGFGPWWGGGYWGPPPVVIIKPNPSSGGGDKH